jgi:predicted ATPase/DNA-binding SARP family transcriptional activator
MIKLCLLGSFELIAEDHAIHLPTRKMESLLTYLLLHPAVQNRERLAALFWGDSPDELARRSLRTALSALRKELGEDFLITDRDTVQLNPQFPLWVDVREMETQAREILAANHHNVLNIDVDLYRGDFLQDYYDEWVLEERDRYRSLFIEALAHFAQILKSKGEYQRAITVAQKIISIDSVNESAYQQLIFSYQALGKRSEALKSYDECQRRLGDQLGVKPSAETIALYEQIKKSSGMTSGRAKSNLPIPLTSFIGREQEIKSLEEIFEGTRLLTLTGVGGCGKTRLAIQLAGQISGQFSDGVWWVELAAIQDEKLLVQTVKKTLGISDNEIASAEESMINYLNTKRVLLVVDNCEHVITTCAQLIEKILSQCSSVKILATSREALSIHGEIAWLVPSLSLPPRDQANDILKWECPRLFVERAASFRPDLQVTDLSIPALLRICRALEGIPLAIELAAARVKTLSLEQLAARIDDKLTLLTTGSRTALPRQQTLRATIDWSYELLSAREQFILQRLSVFYGTWTLEAAEFVCMGDDFAASQILDFITRLLDKSLIVSENHNGEIRYRMLEIIRQYAQEKLAERNETEIVRDRHLQYYLDLAQKANPHWFSRNQANLIKQFNAEYPNLLVALTRGLESLGHLNNLILGIKLASALGPFWNFLAEYNEGQMWLKKAIDQVNVLLAAPDLGSEKRTDFLSIKAKALYEYGFLVWFQSKYSQVEAILSECAEIYQEIGDPIGVAYTSIFLGHAIWGFGDREVARRIWAQALEQFYKVNDQWGAAMIHSFIGRADREATNYDEAEYQYNRCVELFSTVGDDWGLGIGLSHLGMLAFQKGDPIRAKELFEQRLVLAKKIGFKQSIAYATFLIGMSTWKLGDVAQVQKNMREALPYYYEMGSYLALTHCLLGLAWVEAKNGHTEQAAYLWGAVTQTDETDRLRNVFEDIYFHKPLVAWLQSRFGDGKYQEAIESGRRLSVYQIAEEILKT